MADDAEWGQRLTDAAQALRPSECQVIVTLAIDRAGCVRQFVSAETSEIAHEIRAAMLDFQRAIGVTISGKPPRFIVLTDAEAPKH